MKVYDGAALIADKANAEIVPVRIEGLEQTPFSRLSKGQVRRRWFPKVRVTILEPVKLTVDPELKGRKRRQAAGAALYGIMSDLVFRTTSTDRTMVEAIIQAAEIHGRSRVAVEDPVTGALSTNGCSSAPPFSAPSSCRWRRRDAPLASCCRTRTAPSLRFWD